MVSLTGVIVIIALALVGLCLGSFAGATAWRLRARQLTADKKAGLEVTKTEWQRLEPLAKGAFGRNDRSRCLHCGYQLKWYDLIPLFSWLSLKGKCRQCRKPIGYFEPFMELGTALFFVGSYAFWPAALTAPLAILHFALWLVAGVALAILFAYDMKWFLLPDGLNLAVIVIGVIVSLQTILSAAQPLDAFISVAASIGILSGLYLLLYLVSRGRWVGFGDVKLGLGLGLLLADWRFAAVALFAANLIGTLAVIPGLATGKLGGRSRVPFGPLLIIGAVVAQWWGLPIVDWYSSFTLLS